MDKQMKRANEALKEVARRNGVPLEEVLREISHCIAEGMARCREEQNISALQQWAAIPKTGETPTPQEFIAYLGGKVSQKNSPLT